MALADIITSIAADMAVEHPTLTSRVGARWIADNQDPPPRIVWVPGKDGFEGPWNNSQEPRQLLTCNTRMVAHVWGAGEAGDSFASTEALKNNLLASLYRVAHGYYQLGAGTWTSEDGRIADAGGLYLLEVAFAIPITDRALTQVTITSTQQTNVGAFPDGDETDSVVDTPP